MLQKIWPTPFKVKPGNPISLVVQIVIFLVVCAIAGLIINFLRAIPVIGIIFSILSSLMGIYSIVGIVLCVLNFLGVLK